MKLFVLFFLIGFSLSIAQTIVFDQEYYSIIRNRTIEFKQVNDSLHISSCKGIGKCDLIRKVSYKIEMDSLIDNKTKVIKISGEKNNNTIIKNKGITIVEYENNRRGIKESYSFDGKEYVQYILLYPKSELDSLKPISEISKVESKNIFMEFLSYVKSFDRRELDIDDFKHWAKFNDMVIKRGYNPMGAEGVIGKNAD